MLSALLLAASSGLIAARRPRCFPSDRAAARARRAAHCGGRRGAGRRIGIEVLAHWRAGLRPDADAHAAHGLHGVVAPASAGAGARRDGGLRDRAPPRRLLNRRRRVVFDNLALLWHYTVAQGLVRPAARARLSEDRYERAALRPSPICSASSSGLRCGSRISACCTAPRRWSARRPRLGASHGSGSARPRRSRRSGASVRSLAACMRRRHRQIRGRAHRCGILAQGGAAAGSAFRIGVIWTVFPVAVLPVCARPAG